MFETLSSGKTISGLFLDTSTADGIVKSSLSFGVSLTLILLTLASVSLAAQGSSLQEIINVLSTLLGGSFLVSSSLWSLTLIYSHFSHAEDALPRMELAKFGGVALVSLATLFLMGMMLAS